MSDSPTVPPRPLRVRVLAAIVSTALAVAGAVGVGAAQPSPSAQAVTQQASYIQRHISWAQDSQRRFGVPASVTLAQSILESGWGRSALTVNANNYFGIKCGSNVSPYQNGCYTISTQEYVNGAYTTVSAQFRRYDSPYGSFMDHGAFLRGTRYAAAFQYQTNPDQFITEVWKAGYATAPDYLQKVITIMRTYGLYAYDLGATPVVDPGPSPITLTQRPVRPPVRTATARAETTVATTTPSRPSATDTPAAVPSPTTTRAPAPGSPVQQQDPLVASVADQVSVRDVLQPNHAKPAPLPALAPRRPRTALTTSTALTAPREPARHALSVGASQPRRRPGTQPLVVVRERMPGFVGPVAARESLLGMRVESPWCPLPLD